MPPKSKSIQKSIQLEKQETPEIRWIIRGNTGPIKQVLIDGGAMWDGKLIAWQYPGAELPVSIQAAINDVLGEGGTIPDLPLQLSGKGTGERAILNEAAPASKPIHLNPKFDSRLKGFFDGKWHIKKQGVESTLCGIDWAGLGVHDQNPTCQRCVDIDAGLEEFLPPLFEDFKVGDWVKHRIHDDIRGQIAKIVPTKIPVSGTVDYYYLTYPGMPKTAEIKCRRDELIRDTDAWVKASNDAAREADAQFAEAVNMSPINPGGDPDVQKATDNFVKVASGGTYRNVMELMDASAPLKVGAFVIHNILNHKGIIASIYGSESAYVNVPEQNGDGFTSTQYRLIDLRPDTGGMLPSAQVEMMDKIRNKQPFKKNAATRNALRRWGMITNTTDWDKTEVTPAGVGYLENFWYSDFGVGDVIQGDSGNISGRIVKIQSNGVINGVTLAGHGFVASKYGSVLVEKAIPDYSIEARYGVEQGDDWMGWITCYLCGAYLDNHKNRKAQGSSAKALIAVPGLGHLCIDCLGSNSQPVKKTELATLKLIGEESLPERAKGLKKCGKVYASDDIHEGEVVIVKRGTVGRVVSQGTGGLNVQFTGYPHIILCLWDMVTDKPVEETLAVKSDSPDLTLDGHNTSTVSESPLKPLKSAFVNKGRVTPLRQQYLDLKADYPNMILFFRLGDFYETFDEDAHTIARECDLILTGRPISKEQRVPMAGVPHHALDQYVNMLIGKGYSVAVAEQMTEPVGHGVVERKVVRVEQPSQKDSEPKPLLWKAQKIMLKLQPVGKDGKRFGSLTTRPVDANTYGQLAVHQVWTGKEWAADQWTVSHIKSGLSLMQDAVAPSMYRAQLLAEQMSALDFDQYFADVEAGQIDATFKDQVTAIKDAWLNSSPTGETVIDEAALEPA